MSKRIKVFLGGYVNYLNAQNINCRALSEHFDKDKFSVSTMLFPIGNAIDFKHEKGVRYFKLWRPVTISKYFVYFWGIARADIAYLPKGEIDDFCRSVAKIFRTKLFTTVEGKLDGDDTSESYKKHLHHYAKYEPNLFAITHFLSKDVGARRGYKFNNEVLYLGVKSEAFICPLRQYDGLSDIIFIGNTPSIKNIDDFFYVAKECKHLKFHIVGGADLKNCTIPEYIEREHLDNITYHGRLDHSQLSELLSKIDLMYFPSRSEGFPKVQLETACAGVPTLCYGDYGALEWIDNSVNGIVVGNKEEALLKIRELEKDPDKLHRLSENAVALGKNYDWSKLVKTWERAILKMCAKK